MESELEKVSKILEDHEDRINALERKNKGKSESKTNADWYKPGSTIDKLMGLFKEGFFKEGKSISEIILELKSKDYHLKSPDLTLPLRKIVRKKILRKNDKLSSKWLYVEA